MRRHRAVLLAADRQHDDDGTSGTPPNQVDRRLRDPLEKLTAVVGGGTRDQLADRLAQRARVARIVDELVGLPGDRADRELCAAQEALDEPRDGDAEEAGAVVVDEDRNLEARDRGFRLDDLALVASFLHHKIRGGEIGHGGAIAVEGAEVHAPHLGFARRQGTGAADEQRGTREHHRPPARISRTSILRKRIAEPCVCSSRGPRGSTGCVRSFQPAAHHYSL